MTEDQPEEPKGILCQFKKCPECGVEILCLLDGATPRSCKDHN